MCVSLVEADEILRRQTRCVNSAVIYNAMCEPTNVKLRSEQLSPERLKYCLINTLLFRVHSVLQVSGAVSDATWRCYVLTKQNAAHLDRARILVTAAGADLFRRLWSRVGE